MSTGTSYPHDGYGPSFLYYLPNNHFIGNVVAGGDGYGFISWLNSAMKTKSGAYSAALGNPPLHGLRSF
eukprot:12480925-Ditylum_brightwellii.AAC.1